MSDGVPFKVSADTEAAQKQIAKLKAEIDKLSGKLDNLKNKGKQSAQDQTVSFGNLNDALLKYGKNLLTVGAVYAGIKSEISALISKAKELRELTDTKTAESDLSLRKMYIEGGVTSKQKQAQLSIKSFQEAQKQGVDLSQVTDVYTTAFNQGASQADILGGAYDPIIELSKISGTKDTKRLVEIVRTILKREGKTADNKNISIVAKKLAILGEDIDDAAMLFSKVNTKLGTDETLAAIDLGKRFYGGNTKKSIEVLNDALGDKTGGINKFLKQIKSNKQEFSQAVLGVPKDTSFDQKTSIYGQGREFALKKARAFEAESNYRLDIQSEEEKKIYNREKNRAEGNLGLVKESNKDLPIINNLSEDLKQKFVDFFIGKKVDSNDKGMKTIVDDLKFRMGNKQINTNDSKGIK